MEDGGVSNYNSESFEDVCFASFTELHGRELSGGEELGGTTVSEETGIIELEGIAAASVRSLEGGGGGLMYNVERPPEYIFRFHRR